MSVIIDAEAGVTIGIDPGIGGALAMIAVRHGKDTVIATPMPVFRPQKGKAAIDAPGVKRWLEAVPFLIGHVYLERAQAMPPHLQGRRQGSSSAFSYGVAFGTLLGVIACVGLPYTLVMPAQWKKAFALHGSDKEASRQTATRLFPSYAQQWHRKGDHGIAEAVLIAEWGRRQLGRAAA